MVSFHSLYLHFRMNDHWLLKSTLNHRRLHQVRILEIRKKQGRACDRINHVLHGRTKRKRKEERARDVRQPITIRN